MTAHRNSGTGAPTRWSCSHSAPASAPATATTATAYRTISGGEKYHEGFELLMRRCLLSTARVLAAALRCGCRCDAGSSSRSRPTVLGASHKVQLSHMFDWRPRLKCRKPEIARGYSG